MVSEAEGRATNKLRLEVVEQQQELIEEEAQQEREMVRAAACRTNESRHRL